MRGRPLGFIVTVLTSWGIARYVALLPTDIIGPLVTASEEAVVPPAAAEELPGPVTSAALSTAHSPASVLARPVAKAITGRSVATSPAKTTVGLTGVLAVANSGPTPTPGIVPAHEPAPAGLPSQPTSNRPGRWSGNAWAIVRDGGGGSLLSPLLGGAQAGARIAYRLDDDGRVALFARAAAPLKRGPAELAAGAQWRPTRLPVTAYAEVRATQGRASPAAGVFGGGAVALSSRFRLEGYGQAGVIRRDGTSAFGDAQVRLVRPLGPIEAGTGAWAAAQRGASRLDVGPSLALPIPADPITLRVTLDWRHRVAGNARPASGPALSLGADF